VLHLLENLNISLGHSDSNQIIYLNERIH
jgi:hypothetical protein